MKKTKAVEGEQPLHNEISTSPVLPICGAKNPFKGTRPMDLADKNKGDCKLTKMRSAFGNDAAKLPGRIPKSPISGQTLPRKYDASRGDSLKNKRKVDMKAEEEPRKRTQKQKSWGEKRVSSGRPRTFRLGIQKKRGREGRRQVIGGRICAEGEDFSAPKQVEARSAEKKKKRYGSENWAARCQFRKKKWSNGT